MWFENKDTVEIQTTSQKLVASITKRGLQRHLQHWQKGRDRFVSCGGMYLEGVSNGGKPTVV